MIALWTAAYAGTALDGSTGLVTVPLVDTTPLGRVRASAGLQVVRDFAGVTVAGYPVGFASGLSDRVEIGGHIARVPGYGLEDPAPPASIGAHLRYRPVDPRRAHPGLAMQASVDGIGRDLTGQVVAIGAIGRRHGSLVVAAGPRLSSRGWTGWQGAGAELTLRTFAFSVEEELSVDAAGLTQLEVRTGLSVRLRDRVGLLVWGGGGQRGVSPWGGGGLAVQISSAASQDTDRDTILDWNDRCRFEREDLDAFQDDDGCPDPDNDQDGIPDFEDPTPNGEPAPDLSDLPGETGTLKMRIKPRQMPGPIDPNLRRSPDGP